MTMGAYVHVLAENHAFADLERAESAEFYHHVGALGRLFMDIEAEAFALPG